MDNKGNNDRTCSFCGKRESQVRSLIAGRGVYICDECVDYCVEMLEEEKQKAAAESMPSAGELPTPKEIKEILDEEDHDEYFEKIAREKYGYCKPGEKVYYNSSFGE